MRESKTIYEVEEIEDVIDYLRSEKNILDIAETSGISTISVSSLIILESYKVISLKVGQIVTLNKINYPVLAIDEKLKTFNISATGLFTTLLVSPFTKTLLVTKWNLALNYLYGTRMEINEILDNASKDPDQKLIRFPLVWMFVNNKRDHKMNTPFDFEASLQFAFVHLSKVKYRADDRLTYVFKPVLQPIVDLFLEALQSPYFAYMFWKDTDYLNYTDIYRYFYGSSDKNMQVLDAPTDAIELSLDLAFARQYNY